MSEATAKAPRIKFEFQHSELFKVPLTYCAVRVGDVFADFWTSLHPGNRVKARVQALSNALKLANVPRETRREIWAEYWAQGHRRPR